MATLDVRTGHAARPHALSWYVQAMLVLALAWGAFAFGAVYPWAYWPLATLLVIASGIVLLMPELKLGPTSGQKLGPTSGQKLGPTSGQKLGPTSGQKFRPTRGLSRTDFLPLTVAFAVFGAAAALQLVPLPLSLLEAISPDTAGVLGDLNLTLAMGTADSHALSVAPSQTATGILLFGTFALVVFGAARLMSIRGPRGFVEGLVIVGVLLALVGIVQKPLVSEQIYGFWTPKTIGSPFGPFVNKNHFAGWMLMALPVTLGLLSAGIARGLRGVEPTWRARALWLSSPDASRITLLAAAAAVMALSLVLTLSKSGISAMMLAFTTTGVIALRNQRTAAKRTVAIGYLVLLTLGIFAWTGAAAVAARFSSADWSELSGRRGAWADAVGIASRFPLTGTGLNTYGVATLFYQKHDLARHYSQAHNDYLQLLAEGGALLTIPAAVCLGLFVALVRRRFREETSTTSYWLRTGAVTGLGAIALQETVEFSLQMPGNAALFAVVCAIAIHRTPYTGRSRSDASISVRPNSAPETRETNVAD